MQIQRHECVSAYNRLLDAHNDLDTDYNDLRDETRALATALFQARAERDDLLADLNGANAGTEDVRRCLVRAATIVDTKTCRLRGPM